MHTHSARNIRSMRKRSAAFQSSKYPTCAEHTQPRVACRASAVGAGGKRRMAAAAGGWRAGAWVARGVSRCAGCGTRRARPRRRRGTSEQR